MPDEKGQEPEKEVVVAEETPVVSEKETVEEVHPDHSPEEIAKATADGWKPDDPKGLSAGEFNRAGSFIRKIEKQNKIVKELKNQVNALAQQVTEAQRKGYEEGLRALEAQRLEAVKYGNTEEFEKIDARVQDIRTQMNSMPQHTPAADQELLDFAKEHQDWVNGDTPKAKFICDKVAEFTRALPKTLTLTERLDQVNEYLKLSFPERYKPEAPMSTAKPAAAVASSNSPAIKSKKDTYSVNDLDHYQRQSYDRIKLNNPHFTVEDYFKLLNRTSN